MEDEINVALEALLEPHRRRVPAHRDDGWRAALAASPHFGPVRELEFANEQCLDAGGLGDRFGSVSFVAAMPADERAALLRAIRALAGDGVVTLRYVVELQLATRAG
jgi:hypothetical protein